jgi:hypothetical protein
MGTPPRSHRATRSLSLSYPLSPARWDGRRRGDRDRHAVSFRCRQASELRRVVRLASRDREREWVSGRISSRCGCVQALGEPLFSTGCMLMGADHGTVDTMHVPIDQGFCISHFSESCEDWMPSAALLPAVEARGHRLPRLMLETEITPRCTGSVEPEYRVHESSIADAGAPGSWMLLLVEAVVQGSPIDHL